MASSKEQRQSRRGAILALHEGRDAAIAGKTAADVPYNPLGGVNDRLKFRFWIRGFTRAENVLAKRKPDGDGATQAT